jgi:hypothetical protein
MMAIKRFKKMMVTIRRKLKKKIYALEVPHPFGTPPFA